MNKVKIFTATWCGPCTMTKSGLQEYIDNGMLEVVDITNDETGIKEKYGFSGIPYLLQEDTGISYNGFMPKPVFEQTFNINSEVSNDI